MGGCGLCCKQPGPNLERNHFFLKQLSCEKCSPYWKWLPSIYRGSDPYMEGQVHIRSIYGGSDPYMEGQVHIRSIYGGSDPYMEGQVHIRSMYGGSGPYKVHIWRVRYI